MQIDLLPEEFKYFSGNFIIIIVMIKDIANNFLVIPCAVPSSVQ